MKEVKEEKPFDLEEIIIERKYALWDAEMKTSKWEEYYDKRNPWNYTNRLLKELQRLINE
jgi:hypothetical protein